jgi:RimJ/RimL family protein N-acetyltransferase
LKIKPVVLTGPRLTLEPLHQRHFEELYPILNPEIWKWYTVQIQTEKDLSDFLWQFLKEQAAGRSLCFAIRDNASRRLIGSSCFLNIDEDNRRIEIGATWFAVNWQRTYANTESKFLMLSHAFETLSCICVQFQTDTLNEKSRKALERLGARCDGILRSHRICQDGRIRDSIFYSIIEPEWSEVRERIRLRLER